MSSYIISIISDNNDHTTYIKSLLPKCTFVDDKQSNIDTIIFIGGTKDDVFKISRSKLRKSQIIGINIHIKNSIDIHKGRYDIYDHIFVNSKRYLVRLQRKLGTKYVHYLPDLNTLKKIDLRVGKKIAAPDDFKTDDVTIVHYDDLNNELPRLAICSTKNQVLYCINSSTPFVYVNETSETSEITRWIKDLVGNDFVINLRDDAIAYLTAKEKELRAIITKIYSNCLQYWNTKQLIGIVQSMEKRKSIIDHVDSVQIDTVHKSYLRFRDYLNIDNDIIDVSKLVSFISMRINGVPKNDILLEILKNNPEDLLLHISEFKRQFSRESIKTCNRLTPIHYGKLRPGWDRIMKYLNSITCDNGILFDPCLDDTFKSPELENFGIIPYTVPWIGIIHDQVNQLCINNEFIKSIITCQALICFTDVIYDELQSELNTLKNTKKVNHNIDLIKLVHPTCLPITLYSSTPPKKIICFPNSQGEKSFEFCRLDVGKMKKVIIGENNMSFHITRHDIERNETDNTFLSSMLKYILDKDFLCNEFGMTYSDVPREFSVDLNEEKSNKLEKQILYVQKLKEHIQSLLQSCDYVTEDVLEKSMTSGRSLVPEKSMVFIDVNDDTGIQYPMIECIMANIPILIRKTLTTTEYLGEKYPLYTKDDHVINNDEINKAHLYLKSVNKHEFMIENLVNELMNCTFYKTLFL
uniref:Uncharacterized protein n=1 Tax=Pithovirus LCPAC401 TaxID=2506595 RepID=A0A481Z9T3_9VIRU|nr:MAG: uncharacterized protein LCPAC401_03110 [Pithovirus LCPAC401]